MDLGQNQNNNSDIYFADLSSSDDSLWGDSSFRFSLTAPNAPDILFPNTPWEDVKHSIDNYVASRLLQLQQNSYPNQLQLSPDTRMLSFAAQKLAYHMHCRSNRPSDNNIGYWRTFVKHFYSPQAKRRICFAKHAQSDDCKADSVFPQLENWKCEICGSTSAKGYMENFDVLPRKNQLYFNSGITDEIMYIDWPTEVTHADGSITVSHDKAVQTATYNTCRVVHQGKLQVVFTPQMQIKSWDFCVQHHEVLLPLRSVESEVNEFVTSIEKSNIDVVAKRIDGVPVPNLPLMSFFPSDKMTAAANKLLAAVRQPQLTSWGLPKAFCRGLEVSNAHSAMKDLMDYSIHTNLSPMEALKQFGPGPSEPQKFPAQNIQLTGEIGEASNRNKMSAYDSHMPNIYPGPFKMFPLVVSDSEELDLTNMLAPVQRKQPKRARNESTSRRGRGGRKKSRVAATVDFPVLDGGADNGKGLMNSSSCSSTDSKVNNCKKDETDLDEDSTSTPQNKGPSENNDHQE